MSAGPSASGNEILVINSGSSSLKFGVYLTKNGEEALLCSGSIDSIGGANGKLQLKDAAGKSLCEEASQVRNQQEAFSRAMKALEDVGWKQTLAIGHRIVHGGPRLREHQRLTPQVLAILKQAVHFAPLHDPPAIAILEAAQKHFPGVPQFVCFDTAFHKTMPEIAAHYPLPRTYWEQGIQRYGFHGLSYESAVRALGPQLPPRTVIAHLGSGASLAAVLNGKSIDTSMGLTPTGGIPMGTRSGDLDPGILLWLLRSGEDPDALESLLNHHAGLKGLSESAHDPQGESDLRALSHAADQNDEAARLAIDIFTRAIAKTVAAYAVSLHGLDALVFTGGIGENSAPVRAQVCQQLGFLGVTLDAKQNEAAAPLISASNSKIRVHIVPADEDGQIARHTRRLLVP